MSDLPSDMYDVAFVGKKTIPSLEFLNFMQKHVFLYAKR
jgi:hypothetical protein